MTLAATIQTEVVLIQQIGAIVVSIVTAIGIIMVALLNRTRQHAKLAATNSAVVKDEVKNDHTTNMRDESDERHGEIIATLRELSATQQQMLETQKVHGREIGNLHKSVGGIRDELRGMREDDRQQREELDEERGRIRALEDARTPTAATPRRRTRTT